MPTSFPLPPFVIHHWVAIALCLWITSNFVNAMPAPNGSGFKASPIYKTVYGGLHGTFGMLPRVAATMFPNWPIVQALFGTAHEPPTTPAP